MKRMGIGLEFGFTIHPGITKAFVKESCLIIIYSCLGSMTESAATGVREFLVLDDGFTMDDLLLHSAEKPETHPVFQSSLPQRRRLGLHATPAPLRRALHGVGAAVLPVAGPASRI